MPDLTTDPATVIPVEAHPSRERWHVETFDAGEWVPCSSWREEAADAEALMVRRQQAWPDARLRLVRETTTYSAVEDVAAAGGLL